MSRTKVILVAAFLLAFAAGASLGLFASNPTVSQPPPRPPGPRGGPESFFSKELNLTQEQRETMRKIWSEVRGPGGGPGGRDDRRAALSRERDQAVLSLLSEEQRGQYQAIQQDYTAKVDAYQQERMKAFEKAFEDARKRTIEILTPEQAAKYEELMKRPSGRGPGGGPPPFPGGGGPPGPGPRRWHTGPAVGTTTMESNTPHVGE
jgi:Spy/CpxP family protein refolding chaperone